MATITLKTFTDEYVHQDKTYETEKAKIEKRITQRENQLKRLRNKLSKLPCPGWINEILRPIAERLVVQMPDRTFDILGPFGLLAETSIHFYKKGVTDKNRFESDNCKSITFRPLDLANGEIGYVNHNHDTKEYPKGSIAEMNGANYPTIPLQNTMTIKDLLKLVK